MEHLSAELSNYEGPHIWGGARCCESQEQEHSWSPAIYRDFVWCHTVPPPAPSPLGAYTVNTTLNETITWAISCGQAECDTNLCFLTVDL
jgi:hypothetical protein